MKQQNPPLKLIRLAGLGAGLIAAALMTGCADSPPWGSWSHAPSAKEIQAALGRPETFIYFARYEVYQGTATREYVYQEKGKWVHRVDPPKNLPEATLYSSPSVKLTLKDMPETQHATVVQNYPRDWASQGAMLAAMP